MEHREQSTDDGGAGSTISRIECPAADANAPAQCSARQIAKDGTDRGERQRLRSVTGWSTRAARRPNAHGTAYPSQLPKGSMALARLLRPVATIDGGGDGGALAFAV